MKKMKSTFKAVGACAIALSLAFSGCQDKSSSSGDASGSDGGSGSPTRSAFKPMVGKDTKYAFGVNLDKEQVLKVVDACSKEVAAALKDDEGSDAEFEKGVAAYKEDPFKDAPEELQRFLEESGLRSPELYWAVVSLEGFKLEDKKPRLGGLSLAVAGKIDLGKLMSAIQKEIGGVFAFEETQLEGETVWHVTPKASSAAFLGMKDARLDPYVASLDGQLLLIAQSRETLEKQIRLYRTGEGKGDSLHGFSAAGGEFAHLYLSGVGDLLRQCVPPRKLDDQPPGFENGKDILLGLKELAADLKVASDGSPWGAVRLGTAAEKDADQLRKFAKSQLDTAVKLPRASAKMKKVVENLEIGGTHGLFEIRNVDVFSLVTDGLVSAVSSTMLSAKTTPMSINGRKLITGIIQANIDRQGKADPLWPKEKDENSSDEEDQDIASKSGSATEYFNALFDMDSGLYGTADWNPAVDGELISTLGKDAVVGKKISAAGLDWCIALNIQDETPDFMPVLISANFNPALLAPGKFDGKDDTPLPIGPQSGAAKSMFGDTAIVVVRKSGAAEVIKKQYLTLSVLYNRQSFDYTSRKKQIKYLTPTGVVEPVGHK